MDSKAEFTKWYGALAKPYKEDFMNTPLLGDWAAKGFNAGFKACQALNDKRIAELELKLKTAEQRYADLNGID